jgi:hypothetical protein
MFNISLYLEKFQAIKDPSVFKREIIAALKDTTGEIFNENEIRLNKGVVTVGTHSILRSEIYQKRSELLERLSSSCKITDIR